MLFWIARLFPVDIVVGLLHPTSEDIYFLLSKPDDSWVNSSYVSSAYVFLSAIG
jgi:hypothetical protein